jgi:hypothetical protein
VQDKSMAQARNAAVQGYSALNSAIGDGSLHQLSIVGINDSSVISETGVPVYYVWLDDLKEFNSSSDINNVIKFGDEIIFPVKNDGVVSAGAVVKLKKEWQFSGLSKTGFTYRVDSLVQADNHDVQTSFLLKIPSLYLIFVVHQQNSSVKLNSLTSNYTFGIEKNKVYEAAPLFESISKKLKTNEVKFLSPESFKPGMKN